MEIWLWVATAVVAVVFLGSGVSKVVSSRQALYDSGMTYVQDIHPAALKGIGLLELAGALGLVLPTVLERAVHLVPIASGALAVMMLVATALHLRRREPFAVPLVLALVAGALTALRLTEYPV
ncbi:DoxX-like family protein [Georgenia satyanarayanai]|uniref:DoxX-like family protein n=1 Tax=Georgenia satyanarayanai TaxID=860221 RepID=A0A2Y8ZVP1_9MICO|nr:DoxX family protein [Georgenia satyanarayanai]PYG01581.1 DoxX-like protein [Georgenia satyanarayanai]SSA36381.1 DoxX-like family protein [Georgenia satyanarayanai]